MKRVSFIRILTTILFPALISGGCAQAELPDASSAQLLSARQYCIRLAWEEETSKEELMQYVLTCVNFELENTGLNPVTSLALPIRATPRIMGEIRGRCLAKFESAENQDRHSPVDILNCMNSTLDELGLAPPNKTES